MSGFTYTEGMEKAMHQSHGLGYAEYILSLKKRLKVEQTREMEYKKCCRLEAELKHTS